MTPLRILIVEDHPVSRLGLLTLLSSQKSIEVVAEAADAGDALALAEQIRPDLMITPLRLGGDFAGVELCRNVKSLTLEKPVRVIVWTAFSSPENVTSAYLSGADSFVHQGTSLEALVDAVRATASGERVWHAGPLPRPDQSVFDVQDLTPREQEVLDLMLKHATNAEIATKLFVELSTVKSHVRNVLRKLELSSRRDLLSHRKLQ